MNPSLKNILNAPRPHTHPNFMGMATAIKWPRGRILARCGDVYLFQTHKARWSLVYGLQVEKYEDRELAAAAFGQCCFHQAECHSLTIEKRSAREDEA